MSEVYIIGHKSPDTDSICAAIAYANYKRITGENPAAKAARAGEINPETEYVLKNFGIDVPELLKNAEGKKLILVDHNEFQQIVDGAEKAEIIEVLDHHRIEFKLANPIFFHTEPVGSTSTLVAEKYFDKGVKLDKKMAGIMLAAILSDTVVFKSPTSTNRDKKVADKLAKIVGVDPQKFGVEVKKAKASLEGKSAKDIIHSDFKDYTFGGKKVGVGQVEIVDINEAISRKREILKEMERMTTQEGYDMIFMMLTDIIEEGTELLVVGDMDSSVTKKAFNAELKDNSVYIKGMMSRKKQVIPPLEKTIS
ncbi:MAG: manganese-dependent inorganic pyrophosphatase [Candidatus Jordarchaeum sp.]|uniref:manganese-dependent inorganic pyrophosphatase n=1 Tax=Candidatus Jordarchaeum sp. TaxID=2823881 RepID=UPI00404B1A20